MTSLKEIIVRMRSSIWEFARYMDFQPYPHQAEVAQAVEDATYDLGPRKIGTASGKGPGKTITKAFVSDWRTFRPGPGTLSVVSSPSMRQCQTIYLAEQRHLFANKNVHPYLKDLFDVQGSRVVLGGDPKKNWQIVCATATTPENMMGYHNPHLSFFLDECVGIDDPIFEAVKSTCSNKDYLIECSGNPTQLTGWFIDHMFEPKHSHLSGGQWLQLRFDCEVISQRHPDLIRPDLIAEAERDYGRESDYFRVNVKGLPPNTDPRSIIGDTDTRDSMRLHAITEDDKHWSETGAVSAPGIIPLCVIAIDFARMGSDEAVIGLRWGRRMIAMRTMRSTEPHHIVDAAIALAAEYGLEDSILVTNPSLPRVVYRFDAIGMGQFGYEEFRRRGKRFEAFVGNGAAVTRSDRFYNRIAEAYYSLAIALRSPNPPLLLPDTLLRKQLTTRFGKFAPKESRLMVEDKEIYRAREQMSPDRADMCVMLYAPATAEGRSALADPVPPSAVEAALEERSRELQVRRTVTAQPPSVASRAYTAR